MRVYEGAVESLTEAGARGAGVRVFRDGRSGYAYGSDLSEEGLRTLARDATASAGVTEPDEHAGIPSEPGAAPIDGLRAPGFGDWTMERRVELALAVERAARERDPLITNVEDTVYSDTEARAALANSNGFCGSFEETQCYAFAYAFAGDGADRMTGMGFAVGRGPGRARPGGGRPRGGRPRARRCTARASPRAAAVRSCWTPTWPRASPRSSARTLSADAVQRGRSLFAGARASRSRRPAFRLVDDGLHPEGLATAPFDGEGVAPADDAADRGRRAAHVPVRHLHGQQGRPRLHRQRRARLVPHAALGGPVEPAAWRRATRVPRSCCRRPATACT